MNTYHELKDMLREELDEIVRKKELSAGSLDTIDKLTHSIKSLETIIAMNEAHGDSGYYPHYYSGVRRDRMGRYSRDDAKAEMIGELREIMNSAPDENMKRKLRQFISEIETA